MSILRERKTWRRPRPAKPAVPSVRPDLTPEESANAMAAIRVLKVRHGGWGPLAVALSVNEGSLVHAAAGKRRRPSAGLALRAARLAGAPMEDVLAGKWPREGMCPMCGRCDAAPAS